VPRAGYTPLLCAVAMICFMLPVSLWCQVGSSGSVTGTITDQTGANVPGATLTLRDLGTNITRTVQSGSSGIYTFTDVQPSKYELTVRASGFKTVAVRDIKLDVAEDRRIDVALTLGTVTESVNIEAAPPVLNAENASTGQVIEAQEVNELPLNGRDFEQLELLVPGSVSTTNYQTSGGAAAGASITDTNPGNVIVADGGRPGQVLFLVDGSDDANQTGTGIVWRPSVDEIAEFKVQTSNMSAEFGYGSSVVNVSTKSGTNQLHGGFYDFIRNNDFDSKSFFAQGVEPLKRNQFGGTVGGPVTIPWLYHGKDKTFWFVSYEGLRLRQATTELATVPTPLMRTGDLSELSGQIYDPLTTRPDPSNPGAYIRDPFPGNMIPADRINSVAQFFLNPSWIPLPNLPGTANNLILAPSVPTNSDQYTVRIDHHISANDMLMGRISQTFASNGNYGPYHGLNPYDPGSNPNDPTSLNSVVGWTHIFSSNMLLDTRASYFRSHPYLTSPNFGTIDYTTQLGIQGFGPGVSNVYPSYPVISISGYTGLPQGLILNFIGNGFDYSSNLTITRGRHTLKMGGSYREYQQYYTNSGQGSGTFNFTGTYSEDPQNPSASGAGVADFILGVPASGGRYIPPGWFYNHIKGSAIYFNDDWKVTPRLTATLGIRYELNLPNTELHDQFATFDPAARGGQGAIVVPNVQSISAPYYHSSVPLSWPVYSEYSVFAADVGISPKYLRKVAYDHIAPRLGLAYQPDPLTVFRVGYGIYYVQLDGLRESEMESAPFLIRESGIDNDPLLPTKTIQTLFPIGSSFSPQAAIYGSDSSTGDWGYSQQWNLAFQRMLPAQFALDIAYVGTAGTHLQTIRALNTPLPGPGDIQPRRPYPDFGTIQWNEQTANSNYNALQVKLERRFNHGLSLLTSFTWSKSIDYDSNDSDGYYDPYNRSSSRGVSDFNVPKVFSTSVIYELPWFRSAQAVTRSLMAGWTVGGIVSIQDGFPYTPMYSGDPSNTGIPSRADIVPGCNPVLNDPTPREFFNTSCFVAPPGPPVYRLGDAGRNILMADSYRDFDASFYKNFLFSEQKRLEIRFEGFNALNEHSFGIPNATVNAPGYGSVSSSSTGRQIQIAGKFYF
jgi:hypothetical protein